MPHRRTLLLALSLLPLAACRKTPATRPLPPHARVLALGDSLTAGQGAGPGEDWPSQLGAQTGWQMVNAGQNGDTTTGALGRLDELLAKDTYDAILIGIGGNDMLRSLPQDATVANLTTLVKKAKAQTDYVAVIATPLPDVWRAAAGLLKDAGFYAQVAADEHAVLVPDVYAKVLSDSALRSDTVHANATGYAQIAKGIGQQLHTTGWW